MIVVEGPDGAGKTTLVELLCDSLGVEARPKIVGHEGPGEKQDLLSWVHKDLDDDPHRGIYDRHPLISDPIYGPVIRGQMFNGAPSDEVIQAQVHFYHFNPLLIFCLPPIEAVRVNVAAEHEGTNAHLQGVLKYTNTIYELYRYRYISERYAGRGVLWDYTLNPHAQYAQLERLVKGRTHA